jgi:hypothetical protein
MFQPTKGAILRQDNTKMYTWEGTTGMKEASFEDWIYLAQDRDRWRGVVNAARNPWVL